jgi:hypothetical protein
MSGISQFVDASEMSETLIKTEGYDVLQGI